MCDGSSTVAALEAIVDEEGLARLLSHLEEICQEKAIHVEHSWGDQELALAWRQASVAIGKCAEQSDVTRVSC
jgi:hypothetical protein